MLPGSCAGNSPAGGLFLGGWLVFSGWISSNPPSCCCGQGFWLLGHRPVDRGREEPKSGEKSSGIKKNRCFWKRSPLIPVVVKHLCEYIRLSKALGGHQKRSLYVGELSWLWFSHLWCLVPAISGNIWKPEFVGGIQPYCYRKLVRNGLFAQ